MIAAHSPAVSSSEEMKDQLSGHLCGVDGVDPFQFHLARGAQRFEKRLPRAKWLDRECKREGGRARERERERAGKKKSDEPARNPRSRKNGGIQKYLRMLRHISTSLLNSLPFFVYTFERHSTPWELWRKMRNQPRSCGCLVYEELLVNRKRFPVDCKERIWYKMHPPANSFDWCPSELRSPWKSCCFKFEFVRRLEHLGQLQVHKPLCQNVHLAAPLPQPSLPSWIHQSPGGKMRASRSAKVQAVLEAFSLSASQFRHRLHFRRSAADNKDKVRKILRICSTLYICKAVESKQLPQLVQKAL